MLFPLLDKSAKRLDAWKGSSMSIAGRSTLIGSSLNNSPIYHVSIYLLPKSITNNLDKIRRKFFFWQGGQTKHKYHLVEWVKICKSKKKGGFGIKDIRNLQVVVEARERKRPLANYHSCQVPKRGFILYCET